MIAEVNNIRQKEENLFCRWFADEYWDLYIWYFVNKYNKMDFSVNNISHFQLCYGKPNNEHAFIWKKNSGLSHMKVDDGEQDPMKNRTPVFIIDGLFDKQTIISRFKKDIVNLDSDTINFIINNL